MSRKKKIFIGVFVVVIVLTIVICSSVKKGGNGITTVETEKVEHREIVETVEATGKIQPKTQVKISADVAGKITYLNVKEGDWVEQGDLLVRLKQERYAASVEQAEANLRTAEANALLSKESELKAEKDYNRTKGLFDQDLESQAIFDQAYSDLQIEKARHQAAREQVEQARAAVKQARDDLSKTTIYAPMSGTISTLNKEVGEIALGSQFQEDVIMIISNLSMMEAEVNVDENDIVNVALGDSARIEVDALPDTVFHGVVSEIASSATITGSGTTEQRTEFEVKIAIVDASDELRPGMTASSDIITDVKTDALGVPIQCVTVRTVEQLKAKPPQTGSDVAVADSVTEQEYTPDEDGFVPLVFIIENGTAKAMQVETGIQSETHIEILKGLSEGDEIVTGSYRAISELLRNHSPVVVMSEDK
jgi:HlyD family secretion protein